MKHCIRPKLALTELCLAVLCVGAPVFAQTGPTRATKANVDPGSQSGTLVNSFLTAGQKKILSHLSIVELDDGAGGTVKALRVTGINVQLVNGLGATNGLPVDPNELDPALIQVNKLGNLIMGYGEFEGSLPPTFRAGSHNLSFGQGNNFQSFGSLVGPRNHMVSHGLSSISGGRQNAIGYANFAYEFAGSSISGGAENTDVSVLGSISGGRGGFVNAVNCSISGGLENLSVYFSSGASISGGQSNATVSGSGSVSGGRSNDAQQGGTSVSGGRDNFAGIGPSTGFSYGGSASVSGGQRHRAYGDVSSISGGQFHFSIAEYSTISGGLRNTAGLTSQLGGASDSTVVGGEFNTALGAFTVTSGGLSRIASGAHDWVSGSLFEDD